MFIQFKICRNRECYLYSLNMRVDFLWCFFLFEGEWEFVK